MHQGHGMEIFQLLRLYLLRGWHDFDICDVLMIIVMTWTFHREQSRYTLMDLKCYKGVHYVFRHHLGWRYRAPQVKPTLNP